MKSTVKLLALLAAACVSNPVALSGEVKCSASAAETIPLCTVLSDAAKYDGKEILATCL
jgi:hypothetical protein